jgi:thioredoxin-like negative regulator of GroEL
MNTKLILASADWCGPCKQLKARLKSEGLSDKFEVKLFDEEPDFFKKYGIKSVPKLIILNEDESFEEISGSDLIFNKIKES